MGHAARIAALAATSALLLASRAVAQDRLQAFAGGQIDFASYGFVGATAPLPGASLGHGLAVRGSAFGGTYDYRGGPANGRVDATFGGAQLDALYQATGRSWWFDGGVGARYIDTHLSPFDRGNRRHGAQVEAAISADGGGVHGPWRVDYYGSYGTRLDDYAARASLTHAITDRLRAGGEVSVEGDPTYDLQRLGPYVGFGLDHWSELQVSAGVSHQSGRDVGGYLRLSAYRSF